MKTFLGRKAVPSSQERSVAANSSIRVWVRSLGQSCRIRVQSEEEARWLLEQLDRKKALDGLSDVKIYTTDSGCLFEIPTATQRTLATLETALEEIPEVDLMLSPESA